MPQLNAKDSRVQVRDLSLFVAEEGEGPPVLLLTGMGYASWCWRELAAALAPRYRAIRLDHRGSGRSDKPPGPYSIELLADDAAAVLEQVSPEPAHVIAHSMGGYVALTLAARHPGKVRSLVLTCTSSGGPGALPVPEETREAWKAAAPLSPQAFAERTMPISFARGWTEAHPARFREILARRLEFPTPSHAWAAQYAACEEFIEKGIDAPRIDKPALVVHGADDRVVPLFNGERLARQLPNARLIRLEQGGHLCFLEDPEHFSHLVLSFLSAHTDKETTR